MSQIDYKIEVLDPLQHLFAIQISFMPENENDITLSLPNWLPGSYMIRDFSKHVLSFSASDEYGLLETVSTSKSSYKLSHNQSKVTIKYQYYAFDLSVRKAYLDQQYGFINPASSCYQIDQLSHLPCNLSLPKPVANGTDNWQPACGLTKINNTDRFSWGDYRAENYLAFTDYPVLMGQLDIAEFHIQDIPHHVVTVGQHFGSVERVATDLIPICQYQADVFGGLPSDIEQYLFLTMITDNGFGGLEHLNSTALVCSRYDIISDNGSMTDGYQTFLSLCSHEYFHTWNIKRLKPKEFIPYQLENEVYTSQLWFYEGMTSYFDDYSLVATGTITQQQYLKTFAKSLTRVSRGGGELQQSVTDSSYFSWTKFYQQDHTAPDQITSYYVKGAALACFADLAIRQHSNGTQSLATLMQDAWLRWGETNIGTTQDGLEALFSEYLSSAHFKMFQHHLHHAERFTFEGLFADFGVDLEYQPQTQSGQWIASKPLRQDTSNSHTENINSPWFGAVIAKEDGVIKVKQVLNQSPAQLAGISVGDVLVAFNNVKIADTDVESLIQKIQHPSDNAIHYFRNDLLLSARFEIQKSPRYIAGLFINDHTLCTKWLGQNNEDLN